jgi:DNA-binding transcriptional LysR family regulator
MDTNWLEDFVCFGRVLNFTKAAAERNITQSAYSRRIMSLEHWVGAELIDRKTFPATLSEAGIEFLPVAKRMLQGLHRSRDEIRAKSGTSADTIRFTAPHSISIHNLMPLLSDLEAIVPELKSQVVSDNLHNCFDQLAEENCDFLMCYKSSNVPIMLDEQAFEHIEVGSDRLLPVHSPSSFEGSNLCLPGWEQNPIPYLQYSRGSFLGSVVEQLFSSKPPNLKVKHMNAFSEALKNLCIHGAGIAWLPEASIKRELIEGKLVMAGDENWCVDLKIVVYTQPQLHQKNSKMVWEHLQTSATAQIAI